MYEDLGDNSCGAAAMRRDLAQWSTRDAAPTCAVAPTVGSRLKKEEEKNNRQLRLI